MEKEHRTRRRKVLGIGVAAIGSAVLSPARSQTNKISPSQAQYQDKPKSGQECDHCMHFVAPASCKLVDGKIDPQGWCILFVQKPS